MSDNNNIEQKLRELAEVLYLNDNKKFTAGQLAPRFQSAATRMRQDLTINQVAFVIEKMAEKDPSREITAATLKELANKFYVSSTKFASEFSDLLETNEKVQSKQTDRIASEGGPRDLHWDGAHQKEEIKLYQEDSDISQIVDSTINATPDEMSTIRNAAMMVEEELRSTGRVSKVSSVLKYKTAEMLLFRTKIATDSHETEVFVPVEIKNDVLLFPQVISTTEKVYTLDSEGLDNLTADISYSTNLKKANHVSSLRSAADYELTLRSDSMGKYDAELDENDVPEAKMASLGIEEVEQTLRNAVLAKESKYSRATHEDGRRIVAVELSDMGFKNPQVTFNGDYQAGLEYAATVNTEFGKFKINVPVEVRGSTLLLPYQFKSDNQVQELKKELIVQAARGSKLTTADVHPLLNTMSYPDLKRQLKTAAHTKNHKLANDIIALVDEKFGDHYRNTATDDYQTWLEESITTYASRCGECNYYIPKTAQANNDYCNLVKTAAKNVQKDGHSEICTRSTYAGADETVFFDGGNSIKISWED